MIHAHRTIRLTSCLALAITTAGCSSLSYPESDTNVVTSPTASATTDGAPSAPVLVGIGFGDPEIEPDEPTPDEAREWSELTRLARLDRQRGELDSARERLAVAAAQLASETPSSAPRRTVFGARARLARDFLAIEQPEKAEALADELFDEVEGEPALGGPATVELAYIFAERRKQAAEKAGQPDPQLRLLRIALLSSESETASQNRLNLAFEISGAASGAGDYVLARRAIDLAVLDANTIAPADLDQMASLKIYKARIALDQGDYVTAEASATAANRIFEDIGAPAANRAIAEATLARAISWRGDIERARAIGLGAKARTEGEDGVRGHPARIVHAELARAEMAAGDIAAARAHFRVALAIEELDYEPDRVLLASIREELAALDLATAEADAVATEDAAAETP